MKAKGKKYVEASKKIDKNKSYTIEEAIKLVKETTITTFDSTIDVAFKLNIDPKKSDQQVRGTVILPNGTGKTRKVLVISNEIQAKRAKEAGADFVGGDDMIEKIKKENWFDYDVIVATPDMMPKLGVLGKILGPKGLMPNPKTGTVSANPENAVIDIKKGMAEYKTDAYGNIHAMIGKSSFKENDLIENLQFMFTTVVNSKPQSLKGAYIKSISISSTMGPGIKLDKNSFDI